MIINRKPLSMSEALKYIKKLQSELKAVHEALPDG